MAAIDNYVAQIRSAVYGKDVREAIAKGIEQCYADSTANAQIARINAAATTAKNSIPADYTNLSNDVAKGFSSSTNYTAGQYVMYNGLLYRFTADHPAGDWIGTDATTSSLGTEVSDLKSALSDKQSCSYLDYTNIPNGTDYDTITKSGEYYVNSSTAARSMINSPAVSAAHKLIVIDLYASTRLAAFVITLHTVYFRMFNGTTWSTWRAIASEDKLSGLMPLTTNGYDSIPNGTDCDELMTAGCYYVSSASAAASLVNSPVSNSGLVIVTQEIYAKTRLIQHCYGLYKNYYRKYNGSAWTSWRELLDDNNLDSNSYLLSMSTSLPSCSFNDVIKQNRFYLLADSQTYEDGPKGENIKTGFLQVNVLSGWTLQILYSFSGAKVWKRRGTSATSFSPWVQIGGGETIVNNYNYTNEYEFPEYNNTYNVSTTPSIGADNNFYLKSTGDTTDATANIVTMLSENGICNLGPGVFYVKNLVMPDETTLRGCGKSTKVILAGTDDGFAIKMGKSNTITNLALYGTNPSSSISLSEELGGRHGILWQGNYTETKSNNQQPCYGLLSDLYIEKFSGGGITCYDTGYGTFTNLSATNISINNCGAGINIAYWSEFHRFTNVRCAYCWYGCINNGGNNIFTNCDFSSSRGIGVLMDNTDNKSPNNAHGSMLACVINHTASNAGVGIKVINCKPGYVFSGCQIFYSQIVLEDAEGITISNTNFGSSNCNITIKGGGTVIFSNNQHSTKPEITITDNDNVHFENCYLKSNGEKVSA